MGLLGATSWVPISGTNTWVELWFAIEPPRAVSQFFWWFKNWISTVAYSYICFKLGMSILNSSHDFLLSQLKCYKEARLSYTLWIAAKKIRSWLLYSKNLSFDSPRTSSTPAFVPNFWTSVPSFTRFFYLGCFPRLFWVSNHSFLHKLIF